MTQSFDVFTLPAPPNWFWWWVMFVPCLGVALAYWISAGTYSGWGVAGVVALFAVLARGVAVEHWKVLVRLGIALTSLALVVMFSTAVTVEASSLALNKIGAWLYPMHQLGLIPLMLTGFALTIIAGINALMGAADD